MRFDQFNGHDVCKYDKQEEEILFLHLQPWPTK